MPPVSSLTMSKSRLETFSSFRVEAETSSFERIAGLRLAKKSSSDLIPKSPFSGLLLEGSLSHLGPPTAPNRIASLSLAFFIFHLLFTLNQLLCRTFLVPRPSNHLTRLTLTCREPPVTCRDAL